MQWFTKIKESISCLPGILGSAQGGQKKETSQQETRSKSINTSDRKSSTPNAKSTSKRGRNKYLADFPELIEIVESDKKSAFLMIRENGLEVESQWKVKGKTYLSPPLDKIPLPVPLAEEVIDVYKTEQLLAISESDRSLFCDLRQYLRGASELPDDLYYDLTTSWVMHTYLIDKFQYSPIIWLFGDPEKGKSRTGKAMIYTARRGIIVESLREAYILRASGHLGASIFFDVIDFSKKAMNAGSADVIMQRFEKGMKVPRVLFPDKGAFDDTEYFQIFGPTILGTNRGIDHILQTRTIQITMQESERIFENHITEKGAAELRLRLMAFRARHIYTDLPSVSRPAKGRLGEITQPLLQIISLVAPERAEAFLSLIRQIESYRKTQKSHSLEAEVLQVVNSLKDEIRNGYIPVSRVTDSINDGKIDKLKLAPQRIGKVLSSLGLERKRSKDNGGTVIVWNGRQIELLMDKYGLKESSVSSESSATDSCKLDSFEETEETEETEELNIPF